MFFLYAPRQIPAAENSGKALPSTSQNTLPEGFHTAYQQILPFTAIQKYYVMHSTYVCDVIINNKY